MPTFDLYSKRRKRQAGDVPDVYSYEIPSKLRVQIIHIWGDALGRHENEVAQMYQGIVEILRREYGVFSLDVENYDPDNPLRAYGELCKFFLDAKGFHNLNATDKALDVIELTFRMIDLAARQFGYLYRTNANEIADTAVEELNTRFKEHGVGYCYSDGRIMRIDSELIHAEAVKPVLIVLRQKGFESAQAEFLAAHEHYRSGNSETLVEALKAFESTMKIICTKRKWTFDTTKGAAGLVKVCLDEGLIPPYWQSHFNGLRSVLESAVPTPRNKQAGHGAGAQPVQKPPNELVAYVLHMTAATILFLTEAERKLP